MNKLQRKLVAEEKVMFINQFKNGVWLFGTTAWLFAVLERIVVLFAIKSAHSQELFSTVITCFLFSAWLFLKPETIQEAPLYLRSSHLISQEYILPFPYLCQVYHLLNLKHLETIHNFSLNNLKVGTITQKQATTQGGIIKFQTSLESPFNPLRMWRQLSVEVDLILHNPYTVELSIPIYNQKRIFVLFNVLPLTSNEHYFFVDIYGELEWWLKPLMQMILHLATCLTLFEDLPYLRALSERNIEKLFNSSKSSGQETMYLYNRYLELHGSNS